MMRLALGALQNPAITQLITQSAQTYGLDPSLVLAIAQRESGLNPNAVSPAGAQGVMQLEPATARALGVTNPFDPAQNIPAGTRYLSQLVSQFNGDLVKAVAAYDWGPTSVKTAVDTFGPNWLAAAPTETKNYVQGILGVTPDQAATSAAPQQPLTIDASTGLPVTDFTNVEMLPNITPGMPLQTKLILGAGAVVLAYLAGEELFG
jgi:soluble lytic murein transglycosylase-like protein